MNKFRKKPIVIEAIQLSQATKRQIWDWLGDAYLRHGEAGDDAHLDMDIATDSGVAKVCEGDWIIKGTKGEFYPCKPDIFAQIYEPAGS